MSLLDLILEQKIIVISVVIAIIPLLIAAGYMVQKSIRQMLSQRKQRQAAHIQQFAVASAGSFTQSELLEESQPAESQTSQQEAAQAATNPTAVAMVQPTAAQSEQENPSQDQAANQIQSLLTSVFADDDADEGNKALLRGTQPVDIRDLAQFCQSVSDRLCASGE
jgi:predicted membrane-bound mannosyltransferase